MMSERVAPQNHAASIAAGVAADSLDRMVRPLADYRSLSPSARAATYRTGPRMAATQLPSAAGMVPMPALLTGSMLKCSRGRSDSAADRPDSRRHPCETEMDKGWRVP